MLPALSEKILRVKISSTVQLNTKALDLAKSGRSIVSLAVGESDFPTPQVVIDAAISALLKGKTKYGSAGGSIQLRKAISEKLLRENQLQFQPDQIIVGIGAKEILFHVMLSLLNEGDEVLIPAPYWISYVDQVVAAGAVPVIVPMSSKFPEVPIDLDWIQKHATSKTVAIVLNSPNNPSGYVFGESALQQLGVFLKNKNWWIIADEIYEYLSFVKPHISLLHFFPELRDRFILINGFSKSFLMTGWRVGYGAGPLSVMKLVQGLQSHSSTCLPGFIEEAALVAIQAGISLVREEIGILNIRRQKAITALSQCSGIEFYEPEGAFYVFVNITALLHQKKSGLNIKNSFDFCEWLLEKYGVAVVPGDAFGAPGFFRMSYAISDEKLIDGLGRIRTAFESL